MKIRVHGMVVSLFLAALFAVSLQPEIVHAQTTAFSYQGQLASNGVPVSGTYNLTFSLYNAASGGSAVAGPVVTNGVAVNNGLFYVTIDFGAGPWNGQTNWLQIGVETNGATSFATLSPRQEVLPVPYAVFANSASNLVGTLPATQLSGAVPLAQLPAGVVTNNESLSVTLDNLTLNGTLNLPATDSGLPLTINSGTNLLLYADRFENFFAGPNAGNLRQAGNEGNTGIGAGALQSNASGYYNTAIGGLALVSNTSGSDNTANGSEALESNTSGYANTASGERALSVNTNGNFNTADGEGALYFNVSGNNNTAVGYEALSYLGIDNRAGGTNNIAIGNFAGVAFGENESSNIDIGNFGVAGESGIIRIGTPGIHSVAYIAGEIFGNGGGLTNISTSQFGPVTLAQLPSAVVTNDETSSVTLDNLTLNGTLNLPAAPVTINSGGTLLLRADNNDNFFAGPNAGNLTMSGHYNTAIGLLALQSNTSGIYNTANGADALLSNSSGYDNTAIGLDALLSNTSGNNNTADGLDALGLNTVGEGNTANGVAALYYNSTGSENTAVGWLALYNLGELDDFGGANNIAMGYLAGSAFTESESDNIDIGNTGVAGESGVIRIGGGQSAAYIAGEIFGNGGGLTNISTLNGTVNLPATPVTINSGGSLLLRADSNLNFFSGPNAGNLTASGSENTGIGYFALTADTRGYNNTANGVDALYSNTSGFANTACGANSLYFNTNGNNNTANGYEALYSNTSGNFNMADGEATLYYNRSGNFNTAIGWGALQNLGSGNGSGGTNNIALGNSAGVAFSENESSNIDIGNTGVPGENGVIRIGTPGIQTATYLAGTVYANGVALSSDRNAKENFAGVNAQAVLDKVVALPVTEWNYKTDKKAEHIGPMAQDFHAAFGLDGADDKHISVVDENGVALTAIKGLNEKLEAENAELKKRLDDLEAQVKALSEKKQ